MEFATLARSFEQLEQTNSRRTMIATLAELFRSSGSPDEITRSHMHTARKEGAEPGYVLRFPRLVAFRENDKQPEDATTVEELIELYQSQGQRKAR